MNYHNISDMHVATWPDRYLFYHILIRGNGPAM